MATTKICEKTELINNTYKPYYVIVKANRRCVGAEREEGEGVLGEATYSKVYDVTGYDMKLLTSDFNEADKLYQELHGQGYGMSVIYASSIAEANRQARRGYPASISQK